MATLLRCMETGGRSDVGIDDRNEEDVFLLRGLIFNLKISTVK